MNKEGDNHLENEKESGPLASRPYQPPVGFFQEIRSEDEVSLKELLTYLWIGRKKILILGVIFFFIGCFHYAFAPTEYVTQSKLLKEAENQTSAPEGLRALGQLGGINIGTALGASQEISSELYPEIVKRVDFQRVLMRRPLYFSYLDKELTLYEYFNEYYQEPFRDRFYRGIRNYTIFLPRTLYHRTRQLFSDSNPPQEIPKMEVEEADLKILSLSPQFRYAMSQVVDRIELDSEDIVLDIDTRLGDPIASSQFNLLITERMRDYLINYKSEKARRSLNFVQILHLESKGRYEQTQLELAEFTDRNQGVLTALATVELERLQDERNLAFQIYSSVAQRLEEARMRLQEDTPVFTTFERPIIPTAPEHRSILIIPLFLITGIFIAVLWIFGERTYQYLKGEIMEIKS